MVGRHLEIACAGFMVCLQESINGNLRCVVTEYAGHFPARFLNGMVVVIDLKLVSKSVVSRACHKRVHVTEMLPLLHSSGEVK